MHAPSSVTPIQPGRAKKPLIVVDGVFFQMFMTGIARVWWSLLTEWARDGFADHILLLDRAGTMPRIPGIRTRVIPAHDYRHLEEDRKLLQRVCDEEGADLFVSTYYSLPLTTQSALMVYDMIPEVSNYNFAEPMWAQKRVAINYASSFLSISENTKRDLIRFYPSISADKVTVAYCGVWPVFRPIGAGPVDAFRRRHRIAKPYFLSVGRRDAYKNTGALFIAFRQFPQADRCQILSVGGPAQLEPEFAPLVTRGSLQILPRVSDEELATAYAGAAALVYPSRYEGFGLPILEAFACGCPVITSVAGATPEVAGDAAIYVNPDDPAELARAMSNVLNPQVRNRLVQAGLERAKQFNWTTMAQKVRESLLAAASFGDRPSRP